MDVDPAVAFDGVMSHRQKKEARSIKDSSRHKQHASLHFPESTFTFLSTQQLKISNCGIYPACVSKWL